MRGTQSNRLGLGARVVAEVGALKLTRDVYPHNTFNSQGSTDVHFGLSSAARVDKLTVIWPSGLVQEWKDVPANQRLRLVEGDKSLTAPVAR